MTSRFLFNDSLWKELNARVPKAKTARAAVAYLGKGASKLLPLKKGDRLVVDLSMYAVKHGATDPREVEIYLKRGVEVFSRASLHAKFFVLGKVLIAGSANISQHARHVLDEAAVLTTDAGAVEGAKQTFEKLCTEPVRKEYLAKCLKAFRPPKFAPGGGEGTRPRAKLWIIGGLQYGELPQGEQAVADSGAASVAKALAKQPHYGRCENDFVHYPSRSKYLTQLQVGDWLLLCTNNGTRVEVSAPSRFLGLTHHRRKGGKQRYLMHYETAMGEPQVSWSQVCRALPSGSPARRPKPRTRAIVSQDDADAILRLWDVQGRFSP